MAGLNMVKVWHTDTKASHEALHLSDCPLIFPSILYTRYTYLVEFDYVELSFFKVVHNLVFNYFPMRQMIEIVKAQFFASD